MKERNKKISMLAKQLCHVRTCTVKSDDNECCYKKCQAFKYAQRMVDLGIDTNCISNDKNQAKIEQYKNIQAARNTLCSFCEANQCESCIVTLLVDQARSEAGIDPCSEVEALDEEISDCDDEDPAIIVCEYETDERYFVYDSEDNCVSGNGFHFEDEAIAYANRNGYPIVKVHRYFIDSDRGGKLYPDGDPQITWKDGKPV